MKFCSVCQSLYCLKKNDNKELVYECKYCGNQEPRDEGTMCVYSSKSDGDYMTFQMAKNQYTIKDPTLPRLSNVKCINTNCLTNQEDSLLLINSHNIDTDALLSFLREKTPSEIGDIRLENITRDEIHYYGEIHSLGGPVNMSDIPEGVVPTLQVLKFNDHKDLELCVSVLKEAPNVTDENLLPTDQVWSKDSEYPAPILSPILREVVSIKYDEVNMKYMYICTTCGSSWKNLA